MKKKLMICLLVSMFLSTSFIIVYADVQTPCVPMANNYRFAVAKLSIENGTATVIGTLKGINGITTKSTVHLYLQQYCNNKWINCESWLKTKDSYDCVVTKTISVQKGYKYRTKASFYAYAEEGEGMSYTIIATKAGRYKLNIKKAVDYDIYIKMMKWRENGETKILEYGRVGKNEIESVYKLMLV